MLVSKKAAKPTRTLKFALPPTGPSMQGGGIQVTLGRLALGLTLGLYISFLFFPICVGTQRKPVFCVEYGLKNHIFSRIGTIKIHTCF